MFDLENNQLFVDAPVAYSVLNADGCQVAANHKFWELFRYPENTTLTVASITEPESQADTDSYLEDLLSGARESVVVQKKYVRGDGTTFWGRLTAQRLATSSNELLVLGVIEDIDTHVHFEAQLREAARDQSEFVARVSHELRNPLHTIAGLAELLASSDIDTQAQRQAGIIMREAMNLTSIVSDLLDIGRFGTGNLLIDAEPFSVRGMIDRSVRSAQASADAKGLRLITTVDDALPIYAVGDAGRVGQIVDNLLGNAIKFTSTGSVGLHVRKHAGDLVAFEVADTGAGVPKDRRSDIFEPFQRLNPSAAGAGLGLAISSRLAESMSGRLQLSDSGPHGSTFELVLPLPETEAPAPAPAIIAEPEAHKASRILVVEDNLETQMLAAAQLNRLGYDYDIVDDGYRALEISERSSYGAILMDWHLPGMDGLETTRRMRQREEREGRPRTPIISVTARAMAADIQACRDAGADDFVAKPASIGRIGEVLEQWAGASSAESQHGASSVDNDAFSNLLDELGDIDLVCSLARTFLLELPRRVDSIVGASNDHQAAQLAAHTLKSTSAMVGAEPLRAIAAHIEETTRSGRPVAAQVTADLVAVAERTETEVTNLIERLENAR